MWLKNAENNKNGVSASSAKPPDQQKLPKQYSGRGQHNAGEQKGPVKTPTARVNIALRADTTDGSDDSDTESTYSKVEHDEAPFETPALKVLRTATYDPNDSKPFDCNLAVMSPGAGTTSQMPTLLGWLEHRMQFATMALKFASLVVQMELGILKQETSFVKSTSQELFSPCANKLLTLSQLLRKLPFITVLTYYSKAYECVLNPDTNVSLLSEFQLRDAGCAIDSVTLTHRTSFDHDSYGTQSFQPAQVYSFRYIHMLH